MRHTTVGPEEVATDVQLQARLDCLWDLIEDHYEEEWRVEYSGAVVLDMTEALLTRILRSDGDKALLCFGAYEEHNPEYQKYEWVNFPDDLLGLYSIQGIYSNYYTRVDGPRSYFFEQGY